MDDQIVTSAVQRCACANIRRTDRDVNQFYDRMLAPGGLYASQFGLLTTIAEVAPITINQLAETMGVDRTTLTRNLEPLLKQHLIQSQEGEDRRVRLVLLTKEGEQALEQAWPLWQKAQAHIEQAFGSERFDTLLTELAAIRVLVANFSEHTKERGN